MKKTLFLLLALFISVNAFSQQSGIVNKTPSQSHSIWYEFSAGQAVKADAFFTTYKSQLGLTDFDEMQLIRTETDALGMLHQKFQQYYKGVAVEGNVVILHSRNGMLKSLNGSLAKGLNINMNSKVSPAQAINAAIKSVNAQKYMWENPQNESFIKKQKGNPQASYYPKAIPVIVTKDYSGKAGNYILAYKVDVYAEKPLVKQDIYVNAQNGAIYFKINKIQTSDVPATAVTKYSGNQQITTDSVSPGVYRLQETGRGNGIFTYNLQTTLNYAGAIDFTDTDNYWNNVNTLKDEVATDAHFGAEKTYDYYFQKFNRNSYDNLGTSLVSYVHYDQNFNNAFWDGSSMTYGDGDGTTLGPLTSLDVCGHEITHAVTENTANLIYQDESGALNEAFSDMFGAAIEFYAAPAMADWFIGEDFDLSGGHGFRNMSNPGEFQQPDTYKGQYWYTGVLDNGGVHTNSGVANYWFFLLSEGGSGINDLGNHFSVAGQGLEVAEKIAYRALTVYLTPTSEYIDTRLATIQAAEDLYGPCSLEMIATANAWFAVGVGQPITDNDVAMNQVLSPVTDCGLTTVPVSVRVIYNGCSNPVMAGEKVYFYYKVDAGAIVKDSLILATNLNGGDSLNFSFSVPADVHQIGNHTINTWLQYAVDTMTFNDTIIGYTFINKLYQNSDVGIAKIVSPITGCHMGTENVSVNVEFYGCEFMTAGHKIPLSYTVNSGTPVNDTLVLTNDFYPNQPLTFTFSTPYDFSNTGVYTISASTHLAIDSLNTNDAFNGYSVKNPFAVRDTIVKFDEANTSLNYFVTEAPYAHTYLQAGIGNNSTKGFKMTGGNAMSYLDMLQFPDGTNTWQINDFLSAKIIFCVDATGWSTANMRFDLKQTCGQQAYEMFMGPGDYSTASNLRVLVNDVTQISPTYNPATASSDPFVTHYLNLDAYAGSKFTVTFESRNISKDTVIFVMDNAYLDNVKFMQHSDAGISQTDLSSLIQVYPNPVSDNLNINYFAPEKQQTIISLFDVQGKEILKQSDETLAGENHFSLNLSSLSSGIYFLSLETETGIFKTKIVKQ